MSPSSPSFVDDSGSSVENFEFTFEHYLNDSARIEADPNPVFGEFAPDAESLTESIYRFHHENGRTYHSYHAGSYFFPNDPAESERLDLQFEVLQIVLDGRNYLAPWSQKNPPTKVLDLATGTGRWAIEMGDEYPQAEIIGTDLSPIQPTCVPPNVTFYVEDNTEDWDYEPDFDYIHTRITLGCWANMPRQIIDQAFRSLRPGGWFEAQEMLGRIDFEDDDDAAEVAARAGNAFVRWAEDLHEASGEAGRPIADARHLRGWFEEAGFVDVQERVYKIPLSGWPMEDRTKRLGELWRANVEASLGAFSYGLLSRVKEKSVEEIEVSLVDVRKAIADQKHHWFQKFYVVWGRKPDGDAPEGSKAE